MVGLRERKAHRARATIFAAMLDLVERQGYEATTVEQVAEQAQLGTSTVYRYFPTKDAILLAPVVDRVSSLADAFTARPADEPVADSLSYALEAVLTQTSEQRAATRRLRAQLDLSPGPRARLWDLWHRQRELLETAVADRLGPKADPLWVSTAAHVTTTVLQMALDHDRADVPGDDATAHARRIISLLRSADAPLPAG